MDFTEQLRKQLRFLENSCTAYDGGMKDEAVRIAVSLRTIFHDTKKSTSLLKHINRYPTILSTCECIPPKQEYWTNLTNWRLSAVEEFAVYVPKLDTAHSNNFVPYRQWWSGETVYLLGKLRVSRKDLVLSAANKDGGAHVDIKHDKDYETILNGVGWSMTMSNPDGTEAKSLFKNGHLAALRQMGYEVLNSHNLLRLAE
ncbi:MAG: hypothetical protein LUM44_07705 [Pyrinomonadaceae bacterium]|nr:hypothetical protein [Pyrinomonadaceae bacterium]